jgi:hypothetical protein
MARGKHYYMEENENGHFRDPAKVSQRASRLADTQKEGERLVKRRCIA